MLQEFSFTLCGINLESNMPHLTLIPMSTNTIVIGEEVSAAVTVPPFTTCYTPEFSTGFGV